MQTLSVNNPVVDSHEELVENAASAIREYRSLAWPCEKYPVLEAVRDLLGGEMWEDNTYLYKEQIMTLMQFFLEKNTLTQIEDDRDRHLIPHLLRKLHNFFESLEQEPAIAEIREFEIENYASQEDEKWLKRDVQDYERRVQVIQFRKSLEC